MNRRQFSKMAAAGSLGLGVAPVILTDSGWRGANDRINVAVIGIRGQGSAHIVEYSKLKDVRVAAICDVDSNLFKEKVKKLFSDKSLPEPKIFTDMRKLFEDREIDAVSIATPNHWHALASIWLCRLESMSRLKNHVVIIFTRAGNL